MQLNNLYKLIKITINIALCIKINTINWLCYANVKNTLYNYVNYIQLCFIFIILIVNNNYNCENKSKHVAINTKYVKSV